ncbi:unnamed protein product [Diamesa serratosioi]
MSNALQLLLNAECSSESDSDFNIEDHDEEDDDFSNDESEDNDSSGDSDDEESSGSESLGKKKKKSKTDATKQESDETNSNNNHADKSALSVEKRLEQAKIHSIETAKLLATVVCCACLGDRSDDTNEIVECDGCGITVHEGCYGVSDSVSVSSTISSCSTEPWFCEACKANVKDPDCELCPNRGGIFKETDVGKWVHLVCALYVPGVAFGEVDQLSSVTLFEMPYSKWGSKTCSLCDDERFARTGVCIGCDAGMCKTFFHVTCAQKAGLLSEAHHEEADQADPFYAHCKMHSDKTLIKHRKRNFNALLLQVKKREMDKDNVIEEKPKPEQERIDRKLKKHRIKYVSNKLTKTEPWVPTQKMPRLLNTSASACKKLMLKAELMGIDAAAMEFQEAQIASLTDIRKKWHVPPAFSAEFVGYYLDRSIRLKEMKSNLERQLETNNSLLNQQQMLRNKYNDAMKVNSDVQEHNNKLKSEIIQLHTSILALCPNKQLPDINSIGRPLANNQHTSLLPQSVVHSPSNTPTLSSTPPPQMLTSRTMSVPTAAALKMGVGFPLNNLMPGRKDDTGRILSTQCPNNDELLNECGICKRCTDQHLLAKCDTCHLYYHLGCLNPPLTRHPKKSKLYGWQCSECDKSDNSGPENVIIPKAPRRSRIRYSKDGKISTSIPYPVVELPKIIDPPSTMTLSAVNCLAPPQLSPLQQQQSSLSLLLPVATTTALTEAAAPVTPASDIIVNCNAIKSPVKCDTNGVIPSSPLTSPITSNGDLSASFINEYGNGSGHHKHKKRKSHKRRHSHSPNSSDRQSSKEHKRKRKRKNHDMENPNDIIISSKDDRPVEQPRIKIKFKAIPLPAGSNKNQTQFFYVPSNGHHSTPTTKVHKRKKLSPTKQSRLLLSISPIKSQSTAITTTNFTATSSLTSTTVVSPTSSTANKSLPLPSQICDVCQMSGTNQNLVKCDDCQKCYHFHCLDPPLKKNPKKRGYMWHCSDCDPTDRENN